MIVCFTGTGNSLAVARALCRPGEEIYRLEGDNLRALAEARVPRGDDRVVWVFPTYSWGMPPVVRRAIAEMRLEGPSHYMVTTCGDDIGHLHRQWRRDIRRRGWTVRGAYSVQMPNTYTLMRGYDVDAPDTALAKLAAMPSRVARIKKMMEADEPWSQDVVTGRWGWVKTRLIYPWFVRWSLRPRLFYATAECTSCSTCATLCPLGNIKMRQRRPAWGDDCADCLRCYHACPTHAVAYGRRTRGKGQVPVDAASLRPAPKTPCRTPARK